MRSMTAAVLTATLLFAACTADKAPVEPQAETADSPAFIGPVAGKTSVRKNRSNIAIEFNFIRAGGCRQNNAKSGRQ